MGDLGGAPCRRPDICRADASTSAVTEDPSRCARGGVELAWRDFGGDGPTVLLLHGLAGYAGEWAGTARWLTERARVIAPDTRGHGRSERFPDDVSRAALVADAAFLIRKLGVGPVVAVGQSLGGLTALHLAATQPELVRGLVLVEATPAGGPDDEAARSAAMVGASLRSWPVPFSSLSEARDFFGDRFGSARVGDVWAHGLEERDSGWWPRFEVDVMVRMLHAALASPSWTEWEALGVPALVVRGERGTVDRPAAEEMRRRLAGARAVTVADAGHDLHLEQPRAWQTALSEFLDSGPQ
jgi:pimeloyl-ACP methyl ester carboxylesterase